MGSGCERQAGVGRWCVEVLGKRSQDICRRATRKDTNSNLSIPKESIARGRGQRRAPPPATEADSPSSLARLAAEAAAAASTPKPKKKPVTAKKGRNTEEKRLLELSKMAKERDAAIAKLVKAKTTEDETSRHERESIMAKLEAQRQAKKAKRTPKAAKAASSADTAETVDSSDGEVSAWDAEEADDITWETTGEKHGKLPLWKASKPHMMWLVGATRDTKKAARCEYAVDIGDVAPIFRGVQTAPSSAKKLHQSPLNFKPTAKADATDAMIKIQRRLDPQLKGAHRLVKHKLTGILKTSRGQGAASPIKASVRFVQQAALRAGRPAKSKAGGSAEQRRKAAMASLLGADSEDQ